MIEKLRAALERIQQIERNVTTDPRYCAFEAMGHIEAAIAEVERLKQEPVRDMPHGWIVNWPSPNGGTKPVYHASAIKPKFGDELDGRLTMYAVYTRTATKQEQAEPIVMHGFEAIPKEGGGNVLRPITVTIPAPKQEQAEPVCGYDETTGNCTRMNCCNAEQQGQTALLRQCLEALEGLAQWVNKRPDTHPWDAWQRIGPAIDAIKQHLGEA